MIRDIARFWCLLSFYIYRTTKHKHQAQHGATIIIVIRQSLQSSLLLQQTVIVALLHIIYPHHCATTEQLATITANFVEISNALEPT